MPHPFSAEIVPLMFPFSFSVDIVDSEYAFETFENLLSGVQFYFFSSQPVVGGYGQADVVAVN